MNIAIVGSPLCRQLTMRGTHSHGKPTGMPYDTYIKMQQPQRIRQQHIHKTLNLAPLCAPIFFLGPHYGRSAIIQLIRLTQCCCFQCLCNGSGNDNRNIKSYS